MSGIFEGINRFDIYILRFLTSKERKEETVKEIGQFLQQFKFKPVSRAYFAQEMKKMENKGLIIEKGKKPKYYSVSKKYFEAIRLLTLGYTMIDDLYARDSLE